jgi:hypothetical protein
MKWKKNKYLHLTLIVAFILPYSCEKETIQPVKVETVSFKKDIAPIFSNKCAGCHVGSRKPDLSSADVAYNSLTKGKYYDTLVPAQSIIYKKLSDNTSSHAGRASDLEIQKILLWITKGAKNE